MAHDHTKDKEGKEQDAYEDGSVRPRSVMEHNAPRGPPMVSTLLRSILVLLPSVCFPAVCDPPSDPSVDCRESSITAPELVPPPPPPPPPPPLCPPHPTVSQLYDLGSPADAQSSSPGCLTTDASCVNMGYPSCGHRGRCHGEWGSVSCQCMAGFTGQQCEEGKQAKSKYVGQRIIHYKTLALTHSEPVRFK